MNAHSIGSAAAQTMSRGGEARVMGITSRGLFLSSEQRVLFVSVEHWRGPLTINVDRAFDCAIGQTVRLSHTRLIFPTFEVDLSAAEVWHPSAPSSLRPMADQLAALKQLASSVLTRKAPEGFSRLLPHLLDFPEKQALSTNEAALLVRLTELRESIRQSDFDQAAELLESLLGLGRGLTPSGDDVAIGVLLALTRGRPSTASSPRFTRSESAQDVPAKIDHAFQRVVDLADQCTTTLSANLIECAANGEADERLINVIDG